MQKRHAPPRGYSLPLAIMLLALLAAAATGAVLVMSSAADTTAAMIHRRQAFYACDGVARLAVVKAADYMSVDVSPTPGELMTAVCGAPSSCPNASTFAPSGFTLGAGDLILGTDSTSVVAPLPNGPFAGMNARQTNVNVTVQAEKLLSTSRCRISENVSLGQIGLFQFFVFSDGYMDVFPGPNMDIDGRVHVNGNFCAHPAGGRTLTISQVTASGRVRTDCTFGGVTMAAAGSTSAFNVRDTSNTPQTMTSTNQSGCTTCTPTPGSGAWRGYALQRWGGNLQDVEHNVPNLKLPFVGSALVPDGLSASGGGIDNSTRMRAIIDPVLPADAAGVAQQKLAFQADVRIINGTWYVANPLNRTALGRPIWSDHPGHTITPTDSTNIEASGVRVGQADLSTDLGWSTVPRRYSYYETDAGATNLSLTEPTAAAGAATTSVVSYGALTCTAAGVCRPGFLRGTNGTNTYCKLASGSNGMFPADSTTVTQCTAETGMTTVGLNFLMAARSGFQDMRVRAGTNASQGKILPLNFDVSAFATALTVGGGELGTYFPSGSCSRSVSTNCFNGIVFIANSWPGETDRFNNATTAAAPPDLWPVVDTTDAGAANVASSFNPSSAAVDRLPYPLCSSSTASGGVGGLAYSNTHASGAFTIPSCTGTSFNRVNSVRVINASTINPTTFPLGLSIVTNAPIYVLGNTNTGSCSDAPPATPGATTPSPISLAGCTAMKNTALGSPPGDWRPMMIAGDALTLLSNNWSDLNDNYSAATGFGSLRTPTNTMYVFASISGNVETSSSAWGGGINNFPRFLERWSNDAGGSSPTVLAHIEGSLVSAFRSVYERQPWDTASGTIDIYNPPERDWDYDRNLSLPANQPPGTPTFFVQAIQQWQRD